MPEVGLISLARHAVSIARMVLPRYRSKFSNYRFLHRVDETALRTAVGVVAQLLQRGRSPGATVAIDGTGLTAGAVSPYFIRRTREHGGDEPRTWTHWLKCLIVIDAAHAVTPITRVLADAEFDSELNHQHVRALGATSVIPAKRGKATWRIHGIRAQMRRHFPRRQYRRRNLIESVFSAIKRKLSTRAPGRSLMMQRRQAFLLGLTFNLYRLRCRPRQHHTESILRMSTEPVCL